MADKKASDIQMDPAAPKATEPVSLTPAPPLEDVPDPEVPAALTVAIAAEGGAPADDAQRRKDDALLYGFSEALLALVQKQQGQYANGILKVLENCIGTFERHIQGIVQLNEHAQYSVADAVAKFQEKGLQVTGSPYTATVVALSPEGFQVTLAIQKGEAGDLVEELGRLIPWMKSQNYAAVDPAMLT